MARGKKAKQTGKEARRIIRPIRRIVKDELTRQPEPRRKPEGK